MLLVGAQIHSRLDQPRDAAADRDVVVAAQGVDRECVVRELRVADPDGGEEPGHVHDACVRGHRDVVGDVGAVDRDDVGRTVPCAAADGGG